MDTEEYEDIPRRDYPHHTTVTMKIDIRKINKDGTLGHEVMGDHLLKKYGISVYTGSKITPAPVNDTPKATTIDWNNMEKSWEELEDTIGDN